MAKTRTIAQVLTLAAVVGMSGSAVAQSSAEKAAAAEALFREGKALMSEGRIAEACDKLDASQKLDPALGTLMNLADCHERAGRTASAWAEFLSAATQARRAGQAERASVAEERAKALEPKLIRMVVSVNKDSVPPGFEVRRDGVLLDPAMWNTAVPVDPGKHELVASAPGKLPFRTEVEVKDEGKTASVTIPGLEAAPVPAAPPVASPAPQPVSSAPITPVDSSVAPAKPSHLQTTAGLVLGGLGLVAVGAGSYFGLSARSKWNSADCSDGICPTRDRQNDSEDARTQANLSTVMFAGGGVLLATGVVLLLTAPANPGSSHSSARSERRLTILPASDGKSAGFAAIGRF